MRMEQESMSEPAVLPVVQVLAEFQEIGTTEQLAALYGALAKASGAFTKIVKGRTVKITQKNGQVYSFDYAELEDSLAATKPSLAANGLSIMQPFGMAPGGPAIVRTVLAHEGGARVISLTELPGWEDIKGLGGNITYLRRYAYNALLCLSADQDGDDMPEAKRGEVAAESGPRRSPQTPPQAKPASEAPAAPRPTTAPTAAPVTSPAASQASAAGPAATEAPRWLNDVEKENLSKLCQLCGDTDEAQVIARVKALTKGERPNVGHYQGLVMSLKAQAAKHAQEQGA